MVAAALFDMDGVLVRSEEAWFCVVAAAGERFRGRAVTREEFAPTFGQGTSADLEAFGLPCSMAELDAFYVAHFRDYADHTWVDPEARGVLAAVRAHGHRIGVVTNTVTPLAHDILRAANLFDLIDFVGGADQVPNAKPAPDLVLHVLSKLGAAPGQATMIGDSRFDRQAAASAGVAFVGYRIDGARRVETLPAFAALLGGARVEPRS